MQMVASISGDQEVLENFLNPRRSFSQLLLTKYSSEVSLVLLFPVDMEKSMPGETILLDN